MIITHQDWTIHRKSYQGNLKLATHFNVSITFLCYAHKGDYVPFMTVSYQLEGVNDLLCNGKAYVMLKGKDMMCYLWQ